MTIAEHTVRLSTLRKPANILDLGCRGFEFADYFRNSGGNVVCADIAELDGDYYTVAISDRDGYCGVVRTADPQGWHIGEGNELRMMTIKTFSEYVRVIKWDIIKMDIEGDEYNILNSSGTQHPIADQVSVEFHAHTGRQTKEQIDELLNKLKTWYNVHGAIWEERHCAGYNYWDVLLIAK